MSRSEKDRGVTGVLWKKYYSLLLHSIHVISVDILPIYLFDYSPSYNISLKYDLSEQEVRILQSAISRATLGRLPAYLQFLRTVPNEHISATAVAKALGLGEVLVRKDLSLVCGKGKPKTGYATDTLVASLTTALGIDSITPAVIVGAGKLGMALLDYGGFRDYGMEIIAAFDKNAGTARDSSGKPVYPMEDMRSLCQMHDVRIGIITVPADAAQSVCDQLIGSGIEAIWNFSPVMLTVPEGIALQNENLALSLAHLHSLQN
ncbi:MAG: redox-sensing transcriptional repressor Rex [Blautia sp.]|nr:redox-sensing transcriptional repressor Rex [Blautia sp.]